MTQARLSDTDTMSYMDMYDRRIKQNSSNFSCLSFIKQSNVEVYNLIFALSPIIENKFQPLRCSHSRWNVHGAIKLNQMEKRQRLRLSDVGIIYMLIYSKLADDGSECSLSVRIIGESKNELFAVDRRRTEKTHQCRDWNCWLEPCTPSCLRTKSQRTAMRRVTMKYKK